MAKSFVKSESRKGLKIVRKGTLKGRVKKFISDIWR